MATIQVATTKTFRGREGRSDRTKQHDQPLAPCETLGVGPRPDEEPFEPPDGDDEFREEFEYALSKPDPVDVLDDNPGLRRRAAHHEAGHYVARCILRPKASRFGLHIVPTWDYIGETLCGPPGRANQTIMADAVVSYAGHAAEVAAAPADCRWRFRGCGQDNADAARSIQRLARRTGASVRALRRQCRATARRVVRAHWSEVVALAEALLVHRKLDGHQADAAMQAEVIKLDLIVARLRPRDSRVGPP
jgi:hypothetical protein